MSDGLQYYAYIYSPIVDGDLDFTNEFKEHNPRKHFVPNTEYKTPTGLVHNSHAVGSALMNAPFFLIGHGVAFLVEAPTDHGYTEIHTGAYNIGTIVYSFFGSWLIFLVLTQYLNFKKSESMFGIIFMIMATPLVYYTFMSPSFSHGDSFFAVSLFMFIWIKYRDIPTLRYWFFMGMCAGLIFLIRYVDIVFIVLPLLDYFIFKRNLITKISKLTSNLMVYFGSIILAFSPHMAYWRILYGEILPRPMPIEQYYIAGGASKKFMDWTTPHFYEFFFSLKHGLLSWHPFL